MGDISYETRPIGTPGRFVLMERQRLEAENRQLKQMLVNNWRQAQSNGAMLIGWGQAMERTAAMFAAHLEELGVAVDVNAVTLECKS